MDEQLLRVVLPTTLLTEIDEHLATEGSSRTRTDFVREAVEQRLLELRFADAELSRNEREGTHRPDSQSAYIEEDVDLSEEPLASPRSLVDTRLPEPAGATVVHPDTAGFPVEPGPLFLHGRDYPSFWCLSWLARWAAEGPLELSQYLNQITDLAWTFAQHLRDYDRVNQLRVTTMFPTSTRNPDSASQTFQASAIGGLIRRRNGKRFAVGPLPLWGVARIYEHRDQALIAPTQLGLNLLTTLEGLSLELPHGADQARDYISYLREHAPGDFESFEEVIRAVGQEPNRAGLISAVAEAGLADSEKLADVYAQAYVSRGREWGLIEPKLIAARYRLTEQGAAILNR